MTQYSREETITLVAKNPAMMALFLHRAMGEGAVAFERGHLSPADLVMALYGAREIVDNFLRGTAHNVEPYRRFVAEMIDGGHIEITNELGRITDPAEPQRPRTVN